MEPPAPSDARVQVAWTADRPYLLAVAAGMLKRHEGAEAVAGRALHFFGPAAGVSLQPFDLEGRAAVVVRRGEEVVAVVRLDDRAGRIRHLHTFARPSLAR